MTRSRLRSHRDTHSPRLATFADTAVPARVSAQTETLVHRRAKGLRNGDSWGFLAAHARRGEWVFVARPPGGEAEIAVVGACQTVRATGSDRFGRVAAATSRCLEQWPEGEVLPGAPLWVGGFAFGDGPLGGAWLGWPAAQWWVPRLLLWQPQ